ncbi:MAG: hypothetical protein WB791_04815 [Waddliaceae bacterium]
MPMIPREELKQFDPNALFPSELYVLDKYSGEIIPVLPEEEFINDNHTLLFNYSRLALKAGKEVDPYESWPLEDVINYQVVCYNQVHGFLERALVATDEIWSKNIRESVNAVIQGGIAAFLVKKSLNVF